MPRTTDTRQRMLRSAGRLLRRQGYAATGWRQVVADSQTPWGSQAHHFPGGKEQLMSEALTLAGARYERLLRSGLADAHPADFVQAWADVAAADLESSAFADGCPIATTALETAHSSEVLANSCASVFAGWHAALAEAIDARGVPVPQARQLATLILAAIEGGLLLARAKRDPEPLRTVGHELASLLHARVPD
jgi:TetR/AcrR family transcriptional regulator, lmrAB and yxaGH operons repressor